VGGGSVFGRKEGNNYLGTEDHSGEAEAASQIFREENKKLSALLDEWRKKKKGKKGRTKSIRSTYYAQGRREGTLPTLSHASR